MQKNLPNILMKPLWTYFRSYVYLCFSCDGTRIWPEKCSGGRPASWQCKMYSKIKKKLKICAEHHIPVSDLKRNIRFFFMLNWGHILQRQNIMSQIRRFFLQSHIIQQVNRIWLCWKKLFILQIISKPARNKAPRLTEIRQTGDLKIWMSVCIRILKDTLSYLEWNSKWM